MQEEKKEQGIRGRFGDYGSEVGMWRVGEKRNG